MSSSHVLSRIIKFTLTGFTTQSVYHQQIIHIQMLKLLYIYFFCFCFFDLVCHSMGSHKFIIVTLIKF